MRLSSAAPTAVRMSSASCGRNDGKGHTLPAMPFRRRVTFSVCVALASMLWGGVAHAAVQVDQQNDVTSNATSSSAAGNYGGQSFTAGLTGRLTQIDVQVSRSGSSGPLTVGVYATSGGLPTGSALASQTIPQADLPTLAEWFSVMFSSPANVVAGTQYAFALQAPSTGEGALVQFSAVTPETYAGGILLDNGPSAWAANTVSADMIFRTYVDVASSGDTSTPQPPPPPVLQQFGQPGSGTCDAAASPELNWGGVTSGGWGVSWAQWMNGGTGGAVCTRTLSYVPSLGRWTAS